MNKKYFAGIGLIVLFSTTVLTSCGIRSTYKEPELPKNLYRGENPTDTTTIASIPWRDYYPDAYLQSLIDEGLENNFDLQIAVTRIQQAEASLGITKAAFFPDLTLVGKFNQDRYSVGTHVLKGHQETYMLGVSSSWELDIWGKMYKQKRGALMQFLQTHAYRNLIQTSLIANIATSYYSLLALDEQLKVTKDMLNLLSETVETMEALKDAGILNGAAVEQSKSVYYSTQVSIPDLEKQIRSIENSICLLIGREPSSILRNNINEQRVRLDVSHGVPSQMLARRPDVKQAEYGFRAAFEAVGVAQASFYPSISISGTIGYSKANGVEQFFKPENIIANIVGNLVQPIFAKKQLTGQLKIAKARQEETLLTFKQTVLTAGNEVSDALFNYQMSMAKNTIRANQVLATETSVYFTKELLNAGEANYTEVLTAQQNLLQAQLGQVNDKLEQLQATVILYRALGGGLE